MYRYMFLLYAQIVAVLQIDFGRVPLVEPLILLAPNCMGGKG